MPYEERRVVETEPVVERVETVETVVPVETVRREPATVVERTAATIYVKNDDPVRNAFAATQLIQTIVWSVVVLVLLVVALVALHVYSGLF
jgi:hypothetical protein